MIETVKKPVNFHKLTKELTSNQENALILHLLKKRGLEFRVEGGEVQLGITENPNEVVMGHFLDYLMYRSEQKAPVKTGVLVK